MNGNYSTQRPQAILQYYTSQSLLTLTPLSPQQGPSVDNINTCNKLGIPVFDSMQFLKLRFSCSFHHEFQVKQKTCSLLEQVHKYVITVAQKQSKLCLFYFNSSYTLSCWTIRSTMDLDTQMLKTCLKLLNPPSKRKNGQV